MSGAGIVDWGVAAGIGSALAGTENDPGPDPGHARRTCDLALRRVLEYTGLEPIRPVPEVELVSRRAWIDSNLEHMRQLAVPLESRAATAIRTPPPFGGMVRAALGAAAGAEAGVVFGYASRRVLGQYQVALTAEPLPPRMLLVAGNLDEAARRLGVDSNRFLMWVAIHEQTHSVQFAAVPWLRDHVAGLIGRLLDSASSGIDPESFGALARRVISQDPRKSLGQVLGGELARALAGPAQAATLDSLQATMAVIEGYAEHVMDAAAQADDGLAGMRWAMDRRRREPSGLADLIARALGLGLKLRQYELGKAWSDAVTRAIGISGLNHVWRAPDSLPSLPELEEPELWLTRITGSSPAFA
ncbi:MAG: zinc-dependent metalloprotease [Actinomycetota bacterium]|nr:zinc-dependent metalloprotease [Actinomycetota bacterium]